MANLRINEEYFGDLLPLIKEEKITDITWNGKDLWIDDLERGRYKSDIKLSDQFVNTFATRLANLANRNFNMSEPLLEAETEDLRISVVDGTVTNTNRSIAIRKTPAVRRLNEEKMVKDGYIDPDVLKLLELFVKGHCSCIVTGDVGSGKTELVKYLTKFIPSEERTISIEDNFELRLSAINPELDAVEIKATSRFDYSRAIKAALRQLCKWLLLSEARSTEVVQLLEAASTGCIVMTTIHSDDVRKLPDRIVNMMGLAGEEKRNDVYNFFDIGIKINIRKTDNGIERKVSQVAVFDRNNEENTLTVIYDDGFTGEALPYNIWKKVTLEASEEEISLFNFLKPSDADARSDRFNAVALNAKITDKGRAVQNQANNVTVNLTADAIQSAFDEAKNKAEEKKKKAELAAKKTVEEKAATQKTHEEKNEQKTVKVTDKKEAEVTVKQSKNKEEKKLDKKVETASKKIAQENQPLEKVKIDTSKHKSRDVKVMTKPATSKEKPVRDKTDKLKEEPKAKKPERLSKAKELPNDNIEAKAKESPAENKNTELISETNILPQEAEEKKSSIQVLLENLKSISKKSEKKDMNTDNNKASEEKEVVIPKDIQIANLKKLISMIEAAKDLNLHIPKEVWDEINTKYLEGSD